MLRDHALKIVLVGSFFSAAIYPLIGGVLDPAHSDTGDTMMMGLYCALGSSAHRRAESIRASQPDRLRGLVELSGERVATPAV